MDDTKEAFDKIKFESRVFENIKEIDMITELIKSNLDSILLHNGLKPMETTTNSNVESISFSYNTLEYKFTAITALRIKAIWNKLPPKMIIATSIYNDGSIIYSIRPKKIQTKVLNYREQHKLIYGKTLTTNNHLNSVLGNLSKDTIIDQYQYYLKLEPYNGW